MMHQQASSSSATDRFVSSLSIHVQSQIPPLDQRHITHAFNTLRSLQLQLQSPTNTIHTTPIQSATVAEQVQRAVDKLSR
jgi:hypothetical protein